MKAFVLSYLHPTCGWTPYQVQKCRASMLLVLLDPGGEQYRAELQELKVTDGVTRLDRRLFVVWVRE